MVHIDHNPSFVTLNCFEEKKIGEYFIQKLAGLVTVLGLDYGQDLLFIAICDVMVMIWLW